MKELILTEAIDLSYCKIRYEGPVVYFVFKEGAELGFPEIRECTYHAERLSGKKPYLVLSDARVNMNVTQEGRKVASDIKEAPLLRGTAVLVKNTALKIATNYFTKFGGPNYPFRAFTDKQKAIDWLMKLWENGQLQFPV